MNPSAAHPPFAVLARYAPALDGLRWTPVSGGFSGASVWRGDDDSGTPFFALKAWQPEITPARLSQAHAWLQQAASLPFIPRVLPTTDGTSFVTHNDRIWDVSRWMPGTPSDTPSVAQVEAACAAIARLHACWPASGFGPCPAVAARLRVLAAEQPALSKERLQSLPDDLAELLRRGADAVARLTPGVAKALRPWATVSLPLQPCVRDLRGEHILFAGTTITGIVDFGVMAEDHIAADLARLLGDFAGESEERFVAGLRSYRDSGGILAVPDEFVRHLARAGTVCSVVGWLQRLLFERKTHFHVTSVVGRLSKLLSQVADSRPV